MKKKILIALIALVVVVAVGIVVFLFRPRPVRIALVNYPESTCKGMMRAIDKKNVTLHVVTMALSPLGWA